MSTITRNPGMIQKPPSVDLDDERTRPDSADQASYRHHQARYEFADSLLKGGERVLDAGCGTGYGPALLSRKSSFVVGVDYSSHAIAYAREHFRHPNLEFAVMDCCRMALPSSSFDVVISFEIFEHLENSQQYLAECRRVLRPGGRLVLSTPNRASWDLHMSSIAQEYEFHINMVDLPGLRRQLESCFPKVRVLGQRRRGNWLYSTLRAMDIFNLRLRLVKPKRREGMQRSFGVSAGTEATPDRWVFSPWQLRQCNHFMAVCWKDS